MGRKSEAAVLVRRELPPVSCGVPLGPCVVVEGDVTTYLHEDEPYAVRHLPGFSALVAIDDGRLVGVQFPS